MNSSQRVYLVTRFIPQGKVLSYKTLGQFSQVYNPRLIGNILHRNPDSKETPCHRVINSQGKIAKTYAFGGGDIQKQILESEGIIFENEKIDLVKYMWRPSKSIVERLQRLFSGSKISS